VTVPLSLLKSEIISFTPPLPTKKTDAIKRLGAGLIEKVRMDHLHYRLNFDLNKSRQKFHRSLKEHHKISNIPKFRCEML
jgi:hypothetical protein